MFQSLLLAAAAFQAAPTESAPSPTNLVQTNALPAPQSTDVPAGMVIVPALTPVYVQIEESLISNSARIGQEFDIVLSAPVILPNGMAIPVGTRGRGWVIQASKSSFGGKPGELLLGARYLQLGDYRIPLRSMKLGAPQGKDKTGLSMGLALTVGVAGMLLSGGKAKVDAGMIGHAKTAVDAPVPIILLTPAPLSVPTPATASTNPVPTTPTPAASAATQTEGTNK